MVFKAFCLGKCCGLIGLLLTSRVGVEFSSLVEVFSTSGCSHSGVGDMVQLHLWSATGF